ncbi:hypothetical protein PCANC_03406 [Puccinia coronata f. sp. avenae]|uniref:Uncharacterized protein n=1 Tax=Puccinia coronata f. sp. avenae TaxID=200324 RepID=A0A2N5W2C1_9BASI|nr:hypothetical protein PCANC_03406 [Puccinia coronata f. sp. avenae]
MMTTASISLVILFSALANALPSGIPTENYVTRSYQGSYPSYSYYGQQLPPYGYGQYFGPAYYGPGQGPFVGQNYGYTSRVISNGPTNGYPGQVWASSGGDQSAPNTIARAATGGAGQQGVGNGQQGVADGQKGGGPEENVRVVSRCGQLDGGGKFCETTRTSGDAQLLDNSSFNGNGNGQADNTNSNSNSQAAQVQALTRQVNQGLNSVNATLTPSSSEDGQSNTSPDLSDLADAQYEQASKNQTSAADTTDGTSST